MRYEFTPGKGGTFTEFTPPKTLLLPPGMMLKMDRYPSDTWEVVPCGSVTTEEIVHPAAAEQAWSGEGLPPVGSVIRIDSTGKTVWDVAEQFIGVEVTLVAVFQTGNTLMVAVELESVGQCCCFRADMVRTAEQMAQEERASGVKQIADHLFKFAPELDRKAIAECLYETGYRKVQP